jgi:hypothetical protein
METPCPGVRVSRRRSLNQTIGHSSTSALAVKSPLSPFGKGGTETALFPKGGRAQARGDLCQRPCQSRGV